MAARDYDQAILKCQELIARQPEFDRAYRKLVEAYAAKHQVEGARSFFQDLLKENPHHAHAQYGLGLGYQQQKKYDEAIACFKQCISRAPRFHPAFWALAEAYHELQKSGDLQAFLQDLLKSDDTNAAVYYGLGYIYYLRKNGEETRETALKYLDEA